ncbi:MAG: hypothetical protein R3F19_20090 [Verrucomicrobiales bacterium]
MSDESTLLAQDNDSWLLPDTGSAMRSQEGVAGEGDLLPAAGLAPAVEDFPNTEFDQAWDESEPPPLPEDILAKQIQEQPRAFTFPVPAGGDDWLLQESVSDVQSQAVPEMDAAGYTFQESVPLLVSVPARAPRNAPRDSFEDMALIDTEFIAKHGGDSHLPSARQPGQAPRHDDVNSPFVPTRVIAATGEEGDTSWKERHRRKSRGRRRRKRVEGKVDRLAGNPVWGPIQGVLAFAAVIAMTAFLVWAWKNNWGNNLHLERIKKERQAREQEESRSMLEASSPSSDIISEQALSVERGGSGTIEETILPARDSEEPLDLSENLDFGY